MFEQYMNMAQQMPQLGQFPQFQQYSQQFNQQAQMQQKPVQQSNMDWIKVNDVNEARSVQVGNGQQAWILDVNRNVFYLKEANNMGICTLKAYRFEEIGLDEPNTPQATYVTKEEFEALKNEIYALKGVKNEHTITENTTEHTTEHTTAV